MNKKLYVIVLILSILFFLSQTEKQENKENLVTVKEIRGAKDAQYRKDEKGATWQKLEKPGVIVEKNTIISTGKDTEVILDFEKGEFTVKQLTLVKVVSFTEIKEVGKEKATTQTNVQLKIGKVNLKLKKEQKLDGKIKINTPTETVSITGSDVDFNVTPYGSEINCKETAKKIEVAAAGLSLNILTREKMVTGQKVEEIKAPVEVIQEKVEKKDVQINLTKEEKSFQVTVNVNLDTVKPMQRATNEELPKNVIVNSLIKNANELPRELVVDRIVKLPVEIIKERINELPPEIIGIIESTLTTTFPTTTPTTTPSEGVTTTTTPSEGVTTTTTPSGGVTVTTSSSTVVCPNQNCF